MYDVSTRFWCFKLHMLFNIVYTEAPLLVKQVILQKAPLLASVILPKSAVDYRSMDLDNFISPILYVSSTINDKSIYPSV